MTTQFAPVLPINFYPLLDRGHYHLVQPHLFEHASDDTIDWFRQRGRFQGGHVTILDNGVIELGMADVEALPRVASLIEPNVIVIPDAYEDAEETLKLLEKFLAAPEVYMDHCQAVMIVPHGRNVAEWCLTAYNMIVRMVESSIPYVIGIPKVLDKDPGLRMGGRSAALSWIEHLNLNLVPSVHLLGVWDDLGVALETARAFPKIAGLDTTLPFANALDGWYTYSKESKSTIPDEWWIMSPDEVEHEEVIWRADVNISTMRHLLQRSSTQGARTAH